MAVQFPLNANLKSMPTFGLAATVLYLSLFVPHANTHQGRSSETRKLIGLSFYLAQEIPFEQPLLMPQDYPWLLRQVVRVLPDGKRALALLPRERGVELRRRTATGLAERTYVLAGIELATGQFFGRRELSFSRSENFGFAMADTGDVYCVIAEQKVMILDMSLAVVEWTPSELSNSKGEKRNATSCVFVSGSNSVLITFTFDDSGGWESRSTVMLWKWKEKSASLFHWDQFVVASLPYRENSALVYHSLPEWLYRFRLEEIDLSTKRVLWAQDLEGFHSTCLARSVTLIVRVDCPWGGGSDPPTRQTIPTKFRDRGKLAGIRIQTRQSPSEEVLFHADEGVHVWDGVFPARWTKFRLAGVALQWPLGIARNENWFVARAVNYAYLEDNFTPGWKFNQFMIFSLDGSKRRLYTSEKFGPGEAITGLALSRDDKTLLVSTSSRLLVYSVQETFSK